MDKQLIIELIEHDNLCLQNEGLAPLHISAIQGDEQMIRFLHGAGAESNLTDKVSLLFTVSPCYLLLAVPNVTLCHVHVYTKSYLHVQ